MKKIFLLLSLGIFGLGAAQYQQNDGYVNNGWYDTYQDGTYFPDDYYYDYPSDYYADDYYENMYNDYQNSVSRVNWNQFFVQAGLSPYQVNLVIQLNRQFSSYNVWNNYYRVNPVRWYYDRFYALERILGSRVFAVFQNNYYRGYSPVAYYNNHWSNYYRPRFAVRPMYRNVNINIYHINRNDFHRQSVNRFGWNDSKNFRGNSNNGGGGFREGNVRNSGANGNPYRNNEMANRRQESRVSNNDRSFNNNSERMNTSSRVNNNRNEAYSNRVEQSRSSNRGFQNTPSRSAQPQVRNNSSSQRMTQPRVENNSRGGSSNNSSSRVNGQRFTTR